jgi:hypothetical protein
VNTVHKNTDMFIFWHLLQINFIDHFYQNLKIVQNLYSVGRN